MKAATKTVKLMNAKQRSAAANAWSFMKSKPYQRIKNSNRTDAQKRTAIEALKERRNA